MSTGTEEGLRVHQAKIGTSRQIRRNDTAAGQQGQGLPEGLMITLGPSGSSTAAVTSPLGGSNLNPFLVNLPVSATGSAGSFPGKLDQLETLVKQQQAILKALLTRGLPPSDHSISVGTLSPSQPQQLPVGSSFDIRQSDTMSNPTPISPNPTIASKRDENTQQHGSAAQPQRTSLLSPPATGAADNRTRASLLAVSSAHPIRSGSQRKGSKLTAKERASSLVEEIHRNSQRSNSRAISFAVSEGEDDEIVLSKEKSTAKMHKASSHVMDTQKGHDEMDATELILKATAGQSSSGPQKKRNRKTYDNAFDTYPTEDSRVVMMDIVYTVLSLVVSIIALTLLITDAASMAELPTPATIAIPLIAQCFFAMWMAMQPFVRFRDSEWDVVDDYATIRTRYLTSPFFFLDVFLTVPFEVIFLGWLNIGFRICVARHFLRWLRVGRMIRGSNPLLPNRSLFTLLLIFSWICLLAHACARIFPLLQTAQMDYTDSIYFVITTMTSVGYGDVVGDNEGARIFSMVVMILGVGCISTVTALATSAVTHKDVFEIATEEKKNMMNSMLKYYNVPWSLQKEIIAMFPSVLERDNEDHFKRIIAALPSFLVAKIDKLLRCSLLQQMPMFQSLGKSQDALIALSEKLDHRFYPALENVIVCGEVDTELFIVVRGILEVAVPISEDEEEVVAMLHAGQFFGEIALLGATKRTATVTTVTPCQLLALTKADFDELAEVYQDLATILKDEAAKRTVALIQSKEKEGHAAGMGAHRRSLAVTAVGPGSGSETMGEVLKKNGHTPVMAVEVTGDDTEKGEADDVPRMEMTVAFTGR